MTFFTLGTIIFIYGKSCEGQEKTEKKQAREGAPGCKAPLLLLSAGLELRLEESRRAFPVIEGLSGAL